MYINKNGSQYGPFEESEIHDRLIGGQLSPNDLGIRHGQNEWQTLRVLFPTAVQTFGNSPMPINYQTLAPTAVTKASSNGLLFFLLGFVGFILIGTFGLVAVIILLVPSNRKVAAANLSSANVYTGSNTSTPTTANTNLRVANDKELSDKLKDFAKLKPPVKLEKQPLLKGKTLIVEQLDRESESSLRIVPSYAASSYGIKSEQLALNAAEIETLIQIKCGKGRELGKYGPRMAYYVAYSNICNVSIIDYKAAKTIGQKVFVNGKAPKTIPANGMDFILAPPTEEVEKYLNALPKESNS